MPTKNKNSLINDTQRFISAQSRFGHSIPIYDDGFGLLYIFRNSMGVVGIVRAMSWEDAYAICEDEFQSEADMTIEEIRKEYNFKIKHIKIIKTIDGVVRPAVNSDYPLTYKLSPDCRPLWKFVKWETVQTPCEDENGWVDNELFQEGYGIRPNGPNKNDRHKHGIYDKDLNGECLDVFTEEMAKELEIILVIKNEDEEDTGVESKK